MIFQPYCFTLKYTIYVVNIELHIIDICAITVVATLLLLLNLYTYLFS